MSVQMADSNVEMIICVFPGHFSAMETETVWMPQMKKIALQTVQTAYMCVIIM